MAQKHFLGLALQVLQHLASGCPHVDTVAPVAPLGGADAACQGGVARSAVEVLGVVP